MCKATHVMEKSLRHPDRFMEGCHNISPINERTDP